MKVLSLFSGVGGFDMGLENAGMETVFQCEWDKHANSILYKHWPDDHTRYKADGTEQADTHRYKQCGNGVASPVAQWIAKHILAI